ncbi:MAG: hypothetical protein L6R38_003799 [Xanthoria sp. 2 TBL-2021]|nr:MAG: hypothetical protein L6R38_003799 [Xanthoria sp. 2 TBL-2021]
MLVMFLIICSLTWLSWLLVIEKVLRRSFTFSLEIPLRQPSLVSYALNVWIHAVVRRLKDFFGHKSVQGAVLSFLLVVLWVTGPHVVNELLAVVALMNRSFDQILDFKDAFLFGCWEALQKGERILTCICEWLIVKLFDSFWGAIALLLFGLLTWPLASSIQSLPEHSSWVADQVWQIAVIFWPQQLLDLFIGRPLIGYAAMVGLVFYSIICVVAELCHRLFAWDTVKNGFVEVGITYKFRISCTIEKVDDHKRKLNDNKDQLVDGNTHLEVKIAKHRDRNDDPHGETIDYQSLYEELRNQREHNQRAVGQLTAQSDVGPPHKNIEHLSTSTRSRTSRQDRNLATTHGKGTFISDMESSVHALGTKAKTPLECLEHGKDLVDLQSKVELLTADLKDKDAKLEDQKETSAKLETALADLTKSSDDFGKANTIANGPPKEVERRNEWLACTGMVASRFRHPKIQGSATLCEQLERLRGSLDVNSRLVEKLEHELGAAHAELKSHAEEAAKPPSKALASFSQSFPQGFDIIPTASIDAQCGFYAVIESIEAMNLAGTSRHLPVPSCADLLEAFESDDVQQKYLTMYTDMGYSDEVAVGLIDHKGYFRIEEVAVALDHWASTKHDLKFQIGYLEKYQSCEGVLKDNPQGEPLEQGYRLPQLLGGKHDDDPERIVVWLHHNGAGENSLLAHYSGMRNHIPSS